MAIFAARLMSDGTLRANPAPALPWWSFTKTVIAALIVQTAGRGEVALNGAMSPHPFTLQDILAHRSGLSDYGALPAYKAAVARGAPVWTDDDFLRAVPTGRLHAPPGARFAYSNIGYMVARQALERATGQRLADLVTDRLTGPLGLTSVRLARTVDDFADLPFDAAGYDPGWVAHGCLMGTPADAVRLLRAILTDPALAAMQAVIPLGGALRGRPWTTTGYGLGLMAGTVGPAGRAMGHSGGGAFSANAVYAFPDLPGQPVVASFGPGPSEAPSENHAVRIALEP